MNSEIKFVRTRSDLPQIFGGPRSSLISFVDLRIDPALVYMSQYKPKEFYPVLSKSGLSLFSHYMQARFVQTKSTLLQW